MDAGHVEKENRILEKGSKKKGKLDQANNMNSALTFLIIFSSFRVVRVVQLVRVVRLGRLVRPFVSPRNSKEKTGGTDGGATRPWLIPAETHFPGVSNHPLSHTI